MFGNIKKKLSSAIQEGINISENLQQQYRQRVGSAPSTPLTPTTPSSSGNDFVESLISSRRSSRSSVSNLGNCNTPAELNMAAGCNLLAKYEDDWKVIHDNNDENACKAAGVATQIENIERRTTTQRETMSDLMVCLSGVPELVNKLKAGIESVQQLTVLSTKAELELERLEDLCEECDLQEFMLQKQFELSQYKQKKMAELESFRQKVAGEHQRRIRQHEERLRQIQRERQAVFDDAFRGDLEEFKQRGKLPIIQKEGSRKVALEEVVLEDTETKDALEDFLNG